MHIDRTWQDGLESVSDRRRHPRYRYSAPITVLASDGSPVPGITLEISESGLSAVIGGPLQVEDTTEVEPVAGGKALARIRRHLGKIYGFEFVELTAEQAEQIRDKCKKLPIYRCRSLRI
jgi:PilZ domain-containing protein